jgi:1,4-dihydroxy-2-naphthoyl-CoA hydrolase
VDGSKTSAAVSSGTERNAEFFNELGRGSLAEHLGIVVTRVEQGLLCSELPLRKELFAPNGFVHGGSVVSLADTTTGYACVAHLPEGAHSFTTLELKANFLRTAREGVIRCEARAVHLGSTTQVWDATVFAEGETRPLALFRCTQLVLYPR